MLYNNIYIHMNLIYMNSYELHMNSFCKEKANWRQPTSWHVQFYCYRVIFYQMSPTCNTYDLQSLQGHSWGTQLNFALNAFSVSKFFISFFLWYGARRARGWIFWQGHQILNLCQLLFQEALLSCFNGGTINH